ncbi:CIC11C00000001457 [Sungouiella intermedia]|uniref:CIC11C00000001457 n=1 Tax=Sungouiella intermedia TaxID=45354 RepID=A0A1L0BV80_9ASCO|nr:CIC11C00000001457 [[Candida] intermedia]
MELPEDLLEASDEASELGPEAETEEDFEEMEVGAECLDLDEELAKPLEDLASDGLGEGPAEPAE